MASTEEPRSDGDGDGASEPDRPYLGLEPPVPPAYLLRYGVAMPRNSHSGSIPARGLRSPDPAGVRTAGPDAYLASVGVSWVPWSSRLASALLGIAAGGTAALGLMIFVLSASGGGVGFGDGAESASTPLGLVFGLSFVALGSGLAYLALGVYRGQLVPSLVTFCAATGTAGLGAGELLLGDTPVSLHGVVRGLGGPLAVLTLLITPSHRRYVGLRLRARQGATQRRANDADDASAAHPLRRGGNVS